MDLAKRKLGFVLAATIIGTPQSTRQTESAHASAIGVRRLRPAATAQHFIHRGWPATAIGTEIRRA